MSRIMATALVLSMTFSLGVPAASNAALTTVRVASDLDYPVFVGSPPNDSRLFIVEQRGIIKILKDGEVLARPFLDIDSLVFNPNQNDERGLLGLAFHPDYANNGKFYLNYINDAGADTTNVIECYASSDPDSAIADSFRVVIQIKQDFSNHNGGTMHFGPNDGYLYIGMGDGGSGGDPFNRAQTFNTLLGKMLRIDVDVNVGYGIPPSNPFVGNGAVPDEIWSYGLRNPYRWSFDRDNGDMYIADVGQNTYEEVSYQPDTATVARNYGWRILEGAECHEPPTGCDSTGTTLPIHTYMHPQFGCRSITGGYVYRGSAIPSLQGTYFFADFCTAEIWSFRYDGSNLTEFTDRTAELAPSGGETLSSISSFGEDASGEMYVIDRGSGSNGEVFKIIDAASVGVGAGPVAAGALQLRSPVPNPFSGATRFDAVLGRSGQLRVEIAGVSGRRIRSLYSGTAAAGPLSLDWDGTDDGGRKVPTGVYFLKATLDGQAASTRVVYYR